MDPTEPPPDDVLAIGIDLGTTGPKVGVFTAGGRLLGDATRKVPTVRPGGGAAEQDADAVWQAVVDATREAISAAVVGSGARVDRIVAVGVDSQYSSLVPVDSAGMPTAPMTTWMDGRGAPHNLEIYEREPDAFFAFLDIAGMIPLPSGSDSLAHLLHFQHDRPDVHARTAAYLEPMDYVTTRLTGRATASRCSAFMLLMVDNRPGAELVWHPDLVRMAGVDPSRLPPLVGLDEPVGTILPDVAKALGLAPGLDHGIPVFPGVNDTQIGGLATRSVRGTSAGICIGTTSVLIAALDRKDVDADNQLAAMPNPLGGYMLMAENGNGGKVLDQVLTNLLCPDDALGAHLDPSVHDRIDGLVGASPPGAGGVLFLPWLGGAMSPVEDGQMRGGYLGLSMATRRADMVRATLEGLSHSLRWLRGPAEDFCGHPFDHITFSGGAARSSAWSQILADVLDRPVHQLADPSHANGRAAALFALSHLGVLDVDEIPNRMPVAAVHEPTSDPAIRSRYDAAHEQFVAAFHATQPIMHALRPPKP